MKNLFTFGLVSAGLAVTLGCGIIQRAQDEVTGGSNTSNSNRTIEDKAVDVAVGDTKIGIRECDEVVEILNEQINNPEDNFVTKALKRTMLNQFRDQLKKSLEQNPNNKQAVGEFCVEFKKNIVDSLNETNANKK
jgi:hypothetical protein